MKYVVLLDFLNLDFCHFVSMFSYFFVFLVGCVLASGYLVLGSLVLDFLVWDFQIDLLYLT